MTERTCGWCGAAIDHLKSIAQYCCIQHKKNAGSKRHRERNPGYYKQYVGSPARLAYAEGNRGKLRAYAREQQTQYRLSHPDAARQWWAANGEKHRLYQGKRRAQTAGGAWVVTERDIKRLIARHDGRCAYCGIKSDALTLDHVIPLKLGGRHSIGNLVPACQPCNSSKGARLLYSWRITVLLTQYAHSLEVA